MQYWSARSSKAAARESETEVALLFANRRSNHWDQIHVGISRTFPVKGSEFRFDSHNNNSNSNNENDNNNDRATATMKIITTTITVTSKGSYCPWKKIVKVWMMIMKEGIFAGHSSLALPPSPPCLAYPCLACPCLACLALTLTLSLLTSLALTIASLATQLLSFRLDQKFFSTLFPTFGLFCV